MSADKTEYKKIQGEILQFLFDNGGSATFKGIADLTKKPESEAQYHCDVLIEHGAIKPVSVKISRSSFTNGFEITALGRKTIMEQ